MGLTLIAILTAALLLPGLIATRAFYRAADTPEVEAPVPSLSSSDGIAFIGGSSIAIHLVYIVLLWLLSCLPDVTGLPLPSPYGFLGDDPLPGGPHRGLFALFSGLSLLCALALALGWSAGRLFVRRGHRAFFYGPLAEVLERADGPERFIVAYVVAKIEGDKKMVGYQGTVVSLLRDADRYPAKVILKDVSPFYLELGDAGPKRVEAAESIDWIALSSDDWHNIAFRVYEYDREDGGAE